MSARAQKAVDAGRELQRQLQEVETTHGARLKDGRAMIEQLATQVTALTETCKRLERRSRGLEHAITRNRRDAGRLEDFRRAVSTGVLARHVADAIDAAPLIEDPAPMLIVERLFPDDMYSTLVAAIPPVEAFARKDRTKADYRTKRPEVPVPDLTEIVWTYVDGELIPATMVPAITRRFAPFVSLYYRDLFGEEIGARVAALPLEATDARLRLRTPGYHLDPHLDPKRVLLTMLLYFARPGDSEAHGTAFYRVDGRIVRDHATTYYPERYGHRCELARVVPFRPNTGVVFLNSTAHGADLPTTAPRDVERYALQFYVGPPVAALKDIVSRLPDMQRRTWVELLA